VPFRVALTALGASLIAAVSFVPVAQAGAAVPVPKISSLSIHRDATWGGRSVTITGANFVGVSGVMFGKIPAEIDSVRSSTSIVVTAPSSTATLIDVRVRTSAGLSPITINDRFRFTPPTLDDPINGGWTARHEQAVAAAVAARVASHPAVPVARATSSWSAGMGNTAARRALAWVGLPYSWAGGRTNSPSNGVCLADGGGGENDCKVWGFDCSGLSLYGWGPYLSLPHYAQSQFASGAFHPNRAELYPGDLMFFSDGGSGIGHVVMYVGHGQVVQAWQSGYPVQISKVSDLSWMAGPYVGATRPRSTTPGHRVVTVTGLSSHAGTTAGGEWVTIMGSGLNYATSVVIGSQVVYNFQVLSSTRLRIQMPARASSTAHIRVADAWGMTPTSGIDEYSWVGTPAITSASPSPSGASAGGDTITLTGRNLRDVTSVTFGGLPATNVHAVSSTSLQVTTPAHVAGAAPIVVTTKYGTSPTFGFTYIDPPTVQGLDHVSGPATGGDLVTITGTSFGGQGFSGPVTVMFGQTPAISVAVTSATTLHAMTPPGLVGPVAVTVRTRYGTSAAARYTYLP